MFTASVLELFGNNFYTFVRCPPNGRVHPLLEIKFSYLKSILNLNRGAAVFYCMLSEFDVEALLSCSALALL